MHCNINDPLQYQIKKEDIGFLNGCKLGDYKNKRSAKDFELIV